MVNKLTDNNDRRVQINTTGTVGLKQHIERRAEDNHRSLAQEVAFLVEQGLIAVADRYKPK